MPQRIRRLLALLVVLMLPLPAAGQEIALLLTSRDGAYAEFLEALGSGAEATGIELTDAGTASGQIDEQALLLADWVLAGGVAAAEAVLGLPGEAPLLVTLVSLTQYQALVKKYPNRHISAIVLDQPLSRQLALLCKLMPECRSLGVLAGPQNADRIGRLRLEATDVGVRLVSATISTGGELNRAIERVLGEADAFLALPDPLIATPMAARAILLSSYRHRRPVFAYSRAYVEAGALAAVFSTPADSARDALEWLVTAQERGTPPADSQWPKHFDLAINTQVARALSVEVPSMSTLIAHLRALEAQEELQ